MEPPAEMEPPARLALFPAPLVPLAQLVHLVHLDSLVVKEPLVQLELPEQ